MEQKIDTVEGEERDVDRVELLSRTRGLLLGLGLGDALGWGGRTGDGVLRCSCAVQLAAFTVEGLIRASVRFAHRGICHPPSVVWHAFQRWGVAQGLAVPDADVALGGNLGLTGWLYGVLQLSQRRGSAPATVRALNRGMGTVEEPSTSSAGSHAAVRGLVVGALDWTHAVGDVTALARDVGALTHGAAGGYDAAAVAAQLVACCGRAEDVGGAVERLLAQPPTVSHEQVLDSVRRAVQQATARPRDHSALRMLASDKSASSALAGGVYAAASFPRRDDVAAAMVFLEGTNQGAAAVAGAVLGSIHGTESLPVKDIAALELVWVLDTLARDLVSELLDHPSGGEYAAASDPHWWARYPGW